MVAKYVTGKEKVNKYLLTETEDPSYLARGANSELNAFNS